MFLLFILFFGLMAMLGLVVFAAVCVFALESLFDRLKKK